MKIKIVWIVGLALAIIGETYSAFDGVEGNTISDAVVNLPMPAQFAITLLIGAVLGHWFWPRPKIKVKVQNEGESL